MKKVMTSSKMVTVIAAGLAGGFGLLMTLPAGAQDEPAAGAPKDQSKAEDEVRNGPPEGGKHGKFRGGRPSGGGRGGREGMGMGMLTEEERQRVRDVLAKVWQDPELAEAKEKVKLATDEYRQVLQVAVLRVDPEAEKLMQKMHEQSRVMGMEKVREEDRRRFFSAHGRGGPPGPSFHDFLDGLTEERKQIFMEARRKAEDTPEVKEAREAMQRMEMEREQQRFDLMMRARNQLLEAMVKVDPRVKEFLPDKMPGMGRGKGKGPRGGGGAGPGAGGGGDGQGMRKKEAPAPAADAGAGEGAVGE